jgi:catechol 2,3-dioxygenase-like lactoylglutathione lyase family enzyme
MSKSKKSSFRILAADHTGITVSNLDRSLAFWRDVLGFELSHTAHQTGELAREITGVPGSEIKLAVLKAHVALLVDDLNAVLNTIAAAGWKAAGKPQTLKSGPNAGKRVVYVRDPDGATIEFMQPPADKD